MKPDLHGSLHFVKSAHTIEWKDKLQQLPYLRAKKPQRVKVFWLKRIIEIFVSHNEKSGYGHFVPFSQLILFTQERVGQFFLLLI